MRNYFLTAALAACQLLGMAQAVGTDSLPSHTLEEVVLSANKWEQVLNEIPNKITKIRTEDIWRNNPSTAADMLSQTGMIFVQKSQLGGGSPMIRGFATNRVLLVVDGVRMNNAIYRSGNLQNVISIDPLSLQTAEVIFGPGSLIYGSDAIAGVMDFHQRDPLLSDSNKLLVKGDVLARYGSAANENTLHALLNIGGRRLSFLTSITQNRFADLKMGKYGPSVNYLRSEYVQTIDGKDSIIKNADPRVQRFTGYTQWNLLQKIRFRINDHWNLQYGFTYAGTGDVPRYDRLTQYRNGSLRFAEWNYGPMIWRLHNLQILQKQRTGFYDESKFTIAFQDYVESRNDRALNSNTRNVQTERVKAYSLNWDAMKETAAGDLFYGIEYVLNRVGSTGEILDLSAGTREPAASRYPDGSRWQSASAYGMMKRNISERWTISGGLRYSYNSLEANFSNQFIPFPYAETSIRKSAVTGNIGTVYRPTEEWAIRGTLSTGFRMPNVDDIGKLFESSPGNITVPNPALQPEYVWNLEAGLTKEFAGLSTVDFTAFYSLLNNAIVRRPSSFNGEEYIPFDGVLSRVESLQNAAFATVWGLQATADIGMGNYWRFKTALNYVKGLETDEDSDQQVPLRHASPFFGNAGILFRKSQWTFEFQGVYNAAVRAEDLPPSEKSKTNIYALDVNGEPWSPSWYTLNLRGSFAAGNGWLIAASWENLSNQRYRPYSSGLVAAGSNLLISFGKKF